MEEQIYIDLHAPENIKSDFMQAFPEGKKRYGNTNFHVKYAVDEIIKRIVLEA